MDILRVIKERRSIRKYRNDPIPDEIVLEIIQAARSAPSWANTQVCRYIVVKDQEIKSRLSMTLPETNPARNAIVEAPCVVCILAERRVSGFRKEAPVTNKGDWYMFDAGIAMEHIVLAAWNFGLGTVHVGLFHAEMAERILEIPEGYSIVEMTPLGYFEEVPDPRPRKPLEELLSLNTFGSPFTK